MKKLLLIFGCLIFFVGLQNKIYIKNYITNAYNTNNKTITNNLTQDQNKKININNNNFYGKGIWIWNISNENKIGNKLSWHEIYDNEIQQNLMLNFLNKENIKNVYLYIGSIQRENDDYFSKNTLYNPEGLYNLMKMLNKNKINVYGLYYVNDDPNNIVEYKKIKNITSTIGIWNKKYPDAKFIGIQNDQEVNNENIYNDYLNMIDFTQINTKKIGIKNSVSAKPSWVNQDINGTNFLKNICLKSDFVILMDYSNKIENIINTGNKALNLCNNMSIGIETGNKNAANNETLYYDINQKGITWFKTNIIKKLENEFKSQKSFKGISIHDYTQYFQHIYGVEPYKK